MTDTTLRITRDTDGTYCVWPPDRHVILSHGGVWKDGEGDVLGFINMFCGSPYGNYYTLGYPRIPRGETRMVTMAYTIKENDNGTS